MYIYLISYKAIAKYIGYVNQSFVNFKSFAWSSAGHWNVGLRLPFCLDVCKKTFEHLDALLRRVSEDLTGALDWPPPPQEKECIAVATLNLLRLQVGIKNYVMIMERTKLSVLI